MHDVRANPVDGDACPLGLTHRAYVENCRQRGLLGTEAASARYRRFFREGPAGFPALNLKAARVSSTPSREGAVVKFLLRVPGRLPSDQNSWDISPQHEVQAGAIETESVVIPMRRRHEISNTLCVSSQIGCAMGCAFCETAQMGLVRSLTPAEIVAQWYAARHLVGHAIRNIVFMGMGEPLDNLDGVLDAIEVLTDHHGPGIGMRSISVSTVGRIDGLLRLRERVVLPGWRQLNLAVSINAPNDEIRSAIMPVNRSMPLSELIPILASWPKRKSAAICAEYVLIPEVNDQPAHAAELCTLMRPVRCCVNVIPYNPRRESPWRAPTDEEVWAFIRELERHGQFCKRRGTKGRDVMAACGQLGNEEIRNRRFVGVRSADGAALSTSGGLAALT